MLLYKFLNPIVGTLLNSPLHGVMSKNTMIIYFKGRKSGRALSTPVSYARNGQQVRCFTSRATPWGKNVAASSTVEVLIQGSRHKASVSVEADNVQHIATQLTDFLTQVPRDASFSGVSMNKDGTPNAHDILNAASTLICVELTLVD